MMTKLDFEWSLKWNDLRWKKQTSSYKSVSCIVKAVEVVLYRLHRFASPD